jgi:hypothetical protein
MLYYKLKLNFLQTFINSNIQILHTKSSSIQITILHTSQLELRTKQLAFILVEEWFTFFNNVN